ncbi:TPA: NUDIX hydrolase [Shewanella algae]|uniref:NUDIX hydrolase n=1 Tax=Shewanella algae TaxID=38313 RepID=UPI001C58885A|nr:NUDIX domain-containing protein [Shewanella algae]HDS1211512.1 NUDIX hydrolase [Shewanella algae]
MTVTTEAEYLAQYNIHDYPLPLTSVDSVLLCVREGQLCVLLVKRSGFPCKGMWALPGGFIDLLQDEDIDASAKRKLKQKTGIVPPYLEQLQSIGNGRRDPRGWSVTISYYALMPHLEPVMEGSEESRWFSLQSLPEHLAFDHADIIALAQDRLRQKALYSLVAAFALPELFTLAELQRVHEAILGKPLQKKSFRRRIEQAGVLAPCGEGRVEVGRPPQLYRVLPEAADYRFVRNLEA